MPKKEMPKMELIKSFGESYNPAYPLYKTILQVVRWGSGMPQFEFRSYWRYNADEEWRAGKIVGLKAGTMDWLEKNLTEVKGLLLQNPPAPSTQDEPEKEIW